MGRPFYLLDYGTAMHLRLRYEIARVKLIVRRMKLLSSLPTFSAAGSLMQNASTASRDPWFKARLREEYQRRRQNNRQEKKQGKKRARHSRKESAQQNMAETVGYEDDMYDWCEEAGHMGKSQDWTNVTDEGHREHDNFVDRYGERPPCNEKSVAHPSTCDCNTCLIRARRMSTVNLGGNRSQHGDELIFEHHLLCNCGACTEAVFANSDFIAQGQSDYPGAAADREFVERVLYKHGRIGDIRTCIEQELALQNNGEQIHWQEDFKRQTEIGHHEEITYQEYQAETINEGDTAWFEDVSSIIGIALDGTEERRYVPYRAEYETSIQVADVKESTGTGKHH